MSQHAITPAGAAPGCPVDESFDPLSAEFLADPYYVMARLPRDLKPVFFAPSIGYYVVTGYDAVEQRLLPRPAGLAGPHEPMTA